MKTKSQILNQVGLDTKKVLYRSQIKKQMKDYEKLIPDILNLYHKGIISKKCKKDKITLNDWLVILRNIARDNGSYLLWKRCSEKDSGKWKTSYGYKLIK